MAVHRGDSGKGAAAVAGMTKVKIRICRSGNEYPTLHLMVTDNQHYLDQKGAVVLMDIDKCVDRIRTWLTAAMKKEQEKHDQPKVSH